MNGRLVRSDKPCDLCQRRVKLVVGKDRKGDYALYTHKQGHICQLCAKKLRVV